MKKPKDTTTNIRVHTQRELAEALSLCPETISRWTKARLIPCHRVGRVVRYDLAAVLRAIEMGKDTKGGNK
jgi:Helix-turn-helix domain